VQLPPAHNDAKPEHFTRQGEADDDNTIAAMTRLGEPSVTTIFLTPTEAKKFINSQQLNLDRIREILACSTRISKRGLVDALIAQKNPPTWKSTLLRNCRYLVTDDRGEVTIDKWQIKLDPQLGIVIESA
jgi:CRISPR-associated endonuclease/helicase Cas3